MPTKRPEAAELFPVIYGELRRVAGRYLSRERRNHTLQPTALVHEAWLKLQTNAACSCTAAPTAWRSRRRPCGGCSSITAGIRNATNAAAAFSQLRSMTS